MTLLSAARRILILCGLFSPSGGICADASPPANPLEPSAVSMQAYGASHSDCLEWTNGCLVCSKFKADEQAEEKTACSTPGIACQPGEIRCLATRRPAP